MHIFGIPIHITLTESDVEGILTELVSHVGGAKAQELLTGIISQTPSGQSASS
jgi:hypothetical protein